MRRVLGAKCPAFAGLVLVRKEPESGGLPNRGVFPQGPDRPDLFPLGTQSAFSPEMESLGRVCPYEARRSLHICRDPSPTGTRKFFLQDKRFAAEKQTSSQRIPFDVKIRSHLRPVGE